MNAAHVVLILLALVGFFLLATVLLVPIYLFLQREKKASERWTPEAMARRMRDTPPSPNGTTAHDVEDEHNREG